MTSARHAGRVGDFLRDLRRRLKQETRQGVRTFGTQVPCNGCDACCWHPIIKVDPGEEPPENLDHLALEPHPDGGLALKRRADGACINLSEDGRCAVYEYRPRGCRVYGSVPARARSFHYRRFRGCRATGRRQGGDSGACASQCRRGIGVRKRSISSMKAIEGTNRIKAVTAAIW